MSVPVLVRATRGTWVQEVRVLDAGRSVCVNAHDWRGRRRTWVLWSVVDARVGFGSRMSPDAVD